MKSGSPLNLARVKFSCGAGRIDQAEAQRKKPTIFDIRRLEFQAAKEVLAAGQHACRWTHDADDHFRTQCNKTFYLLAGTLAENGFVWCPYCRGRIEEGSC